MKYCALVLLIIHLNLPVNHNASVLDHKVLEFHSSPSLTSQNPDYLSAILNFNPKDSFWDFERKVKFLPFKFEKTGDSIFLCRPCKKWKRISVFMLRKNDTLY